MPETNSLNKPDQTTDGARPRDADTRPAPDAAGHALFERIGVGGMGEVYRCGDDALHRDLAIKVIKAELRGNDDAEERFLREARLTGALQHPGIVPVHNLGRLSGGRLFYTMKLVRGRTLADLLHDEPDGLERLAVVEKVCQAMAYAHSKGVIHRDLKPTNVMVGEFGEVQVMDWGLAKELSRSEPAATDGPSADEETVARAEEAAGLSRAGAALGTPEYMPPEQAAGDWDIVDERADVFAVGAILCRVLTGRPPYHGANPEDLLRKARRGDLAEALGRLERCGSEAALVGLCRDCLAPEREGRPRHAGVLAERLASYQAEVRERLRQAELERARAEVQAREEQARVLVEQARTREALARVAAERRARRLTRALALAALLLLSGGALVWWRQAEADSAVAVAMGEARVLAGQAQADPLTPAGYDKAVSAAAKAAEMARAGGASHAMQRQSEELLDQLQAEAETATKDRRLLARLLEVRGPREGPMYTRDELDQLQAEAETATKDHRLLARLLEVRGPREGPMYTRDEKDKLMVLAEPTADEQFASAFRDWGVDVDAVPAEETVKRLKARPNAVVTEVIAALDEWANQRRLDKKPEAARRVAELAAALDAEPGSLRRELREILERDRLPWERALGVLSAALRPVPVPAAVPWGRDRTRLRQLAERMDPAAEPVLGLLTLTRALRVAGEDALVERLLRAASDARPHEVVLYHTLGQLLTSQEPPRWAEAVEYYKAARARRPDVGVNLATALLRSGRVREGLDLLAWLFRERPDHPSLHLAQGKALYEKHDLDGAIACYQKALDLDPKNAQAHNNLGAALYAKGDLDGAIACWKKALGLAPKYAYAHSNLGTALKDKGDLGGAIACYQKALGLDPKKAYAHNNLGNALMAKGDLGGAIACFQKALDLDPKNAQSHYNLGNALMAKGDLDGAIACYQKALHLDPKNAKSHTNFGISLAAKGDLDGAIACYQKALHLDPKLAQAHSNLGVALAAKDDLDGAIACHQKALGLDPKNAKSHAIFGNALAAKGDRDGAIACWKRALHLDPKLAGAHYNLGAALAAKGDLDGAIACYQKALGLDPKNAKAHYNLGNALKDKGDLEGAIACYQKALELDPKLAEAHCNLGHVLRRQGRFAEAVASLRRGHELGSKRPGWPYPSAQWVRDAERLLALDQKLPALLQGATSPANPGEALTLAQMCQEHKRRHVAAARLYADAFTAEPKLAADLNQQHRYNAACSAALAAAGQGEDARLLPDKMVTMFRGWALSWLRADLTTYAKLAEQNKPALKLTIQQRLAHWRRDSDLTSVRDPQALDRLADNERAAWQALWREVDELLTRVAKKDEPTQGRKEPESPKTKPEGHSLPLSGATGR
jgi:serine/threonine-protein kinase